jgi:hypothetical protein
MAFGRAFLLLMPRDEEQLDPKLLLGNCEQCLLNSSAHRMIPFTV